MRRKPLSWILGALSVVTYLIALAMVFFYAPREVTMGDVQRIFYFHVASAWVGFFGFFVTFVAGILYLAQRRRVWDILGHSSADIGVVFITMTLITGALWAKPVWGTYWTWEPRLTISAIQWLLYVAYGMLRGSVPDEESNRRASPPSTGSSLLSPCRSRGSPSAGGARSIPRSCRKAAWRSRPRCCRH